MHSSPGSARCWRTERWKEREAGRGRERHNNGNTKLSIDTNTHTCANESYESAMRSRSSVSSPWHITKGFAIIPTIHRPLRFYYSGRVKGQSSRRAQIGALLRKQFIPRERIVSSYDRWILFDYSKVDFRGQRSRKFAQWKKILE